MSTSSCTERARQDPAQAGARGTMVMVAAPRLVMALSLTPAVGVLGALALYWSRGWRDGLFVLGALLVTCALGAFRFLRARLVSRVEAQLMLCGLRASRARARAERDVDGLLRLGGR